MKKEVLLSCGHTETIDLPEDFEVRNNKISYLETQGLCSECFKKKMQKEKEAMPFTLIIQMQPSNEYKNFRLKFDGNSQPHKDEIKEMGYKWGRIEKEIGIFCVSHKNKMELSWYKYLPAEEVDAEVERVKAVFPGIIIDDQTDGFDRAAYGYEQRLKKQKDAKLLSDCQKEIERLGIKPLKPEFYPEGYWNGKIYGKAGSYVIYVNKAEIKLSDEQAEELKEYLEVSSEYEADVQEIKKKYNIYH